jgi:diguanylate cyclase (GGDEF)-like protein/PAS domain S-box-containing protein
MDTRINTNQILTPATPGFYKELLDHLSDGVYFVDRERRIQYWNEGAYRLTGYKAEELLGRCCQDDILCHVDYTGRRLCHEDCPLTATIADGAMHEASVFLRHKQGRRVPVLVRVQPIRDGSGDIIGAIEIFSDDSLQSEALRKAEAMKRMAFLDHVTQMPNRRFMEMSLRTALIEYAEHKDPFGVLLIDVDGFKGINDSFGHSCGDRALIEAGRTLTGALRPTDIVGRWGGDEFLAIVSNVDSKILEILAKRCIVLVEQTSIASNDERTIALTISAGAALVRSGETAEALIQRADELMYRSKAEGRDRATTG